MPLESVPLQSSLLDSSVQACLSFRATHIVTAGLLLVSSEDRQTRTALQKYRYVWICSRFQVWISAAAHCNQFSCSFSGNETKTQLLNCSTLIQISTNGLSKAGATDFKNSLPSEQITFFEMHLDHMTFKQTTSLLMQILTSCSADRLAGSGCTANYRQKKLQNVYAKARFCHIFPQAVVA